MSVTFAPRARIAVNASWPGVSRNVIRRPLCSTWYAPMCCVMPPASVSTTDGLADRVEERRLAVVDVAHDRDHGRTRDEILLGVLVDLRKLVLVGHVLDRDLALDLGRDQLHGLVRERLGDRDHLPQAHQDLDDLGRRHAERLRQVLDRHPGGDGDRTGRLRAGRRPSGAARRDRAIAGRRGVAVRPRCR